MEKKVLLATDGSIDSERAVRYLGNLFSTDPGFTLTLFHVMPPLPPVLTEKNLGEWQITSAKAKQLKELHRQKADAIMSKSKSMLEKAGLRTEAIATRIAERQVGLARDIIHEAGKGNYDAVVVGRRGLTRMQSTILGSISAKILEALQNRPVWVIDGKITSLKVLIAMDASENSLAAVDHAAFILQGVPGVNILLYHVIPGLNIFGVKESEAGLQDMKKVLMEQGAERIREFFMRAKEMLQEAGVRPEQIVFKIKKGSTNIARDIRDEALKNDFGTIILSRRGISKTREFFMGSVCNKVLSISGNLAVWVV